MNTIGETVKTERKKMGLTQQQFAKEAGLGYRFIKELEQGKKTVRLDKVNQVLTFLGLSLTTTEIDYSKNHSNTPIPVIIKRVSEICHHFQVKHLYLFGSYAKGTYSAHSDLDFAIKGFEGKYDDLLFALGNIRTLKSIDLVNYDTLKNENLRKEIDKYGRKIY